MALYSLGVRTCLFLIVLLVSILITLNEFFAHSASITMATEDADSDSGDDDDDDDGYTTLTNEGDTELIFIAVGDYGIHQLQYTL